MLHGLGSMRERAEGSAQAPHLGHAGFELLPVYPKGASRGYANVYGAKAKVRAGRQGQYRPVVPKGTENCPVATVTYRTADAAGEGRAGNRQTFPAAAKLYSKRRSMLRKTLGGRSDAALNRCA